jgi:hypothetical protein
MASAVCAWCTYKHVADELRRRHAPCPRPLGQRGLQTAQVDRESVAGGGRCHGALPGTRSVSDIGATAPILHSTTQPVSAPFKG